MTEELRLLKDQWEGGPVKEALCGQKEMSDRFLTASGIEVQPLYTPLDLEKIGFDYITDLGFPGRFPFTRGKEPLGYRQGFWQFGQYAAFGNAEETNKRYRFLIQQGGTNISIALDMPTQLGYDSDHPLAEGEVGKVGVSIDSLADVETLFDGIPLDKLRQISTTANSIAPVWVALILVLAEKQQVSPDKFVIRIQNDILKEYVARGTYIFPPRPSVKIATDVTAYCIEHYPHWFPMSVSGYHMREAGSSAAQEIAFTIANTIAYADECVAKGIKAEDYLSRLAVFFNCGMDFFEEVAKFRAMRLLWARTFQKRYSVPDPNVLSYFLSVMTAGSSLTAQQPMNNIVRVSIEALAAVLGGCHVLYPCSMDEAYCTPTERAVKIALRTQQIIAHETGATRTVDPLAGSYFVESLTSELVQKAQAYLEKVEELGGAVRAIENGYFQKEIADSSYRIKQDIEHRKRVVVGVNQYVDEEELPIEILKVDPVLEEKQKAKLDDLKKQRDNQKVAHALKGVRRAAEADENLIPSLIEAVRVYATLGEMCDVLRSVYGEHTAPSSY